MSEPASSSPAFLLIDRGAVLFCGVAAGIAIGLAFAPQLQSLLGQGSPMAVVGAAPAQVVDGEGLPRGVAAAAEVPAGLARAVAEQRPYRIGVFGDSFGDGLWTALYNQLPRREAFQVLRYSEQATGFTRYAQINLEERLATNLADGPVDVAVISFGANDTQGIYVGGKVAPLLSSRWRTEITARITRYIDLLRGQGASVVWVGLPVMRDAKYQAQVQGLNAFYAELMAELDVPFIDTSNAAVGANGGYASHLPGADGVPMLVRAGDGIHMSMKGYRLLTAALATRLRAWGQAARAGKQVTPDLVPAPAPLRPEPAAQAASAEPQPAESAPETAPPAAPPASISTAISAPISTNAAVVPSPPSAPTQLLPPATQTLPQTPPPPPQAEPAEPRR